MFYINYISIFISHLINYVIFLVSWAISPLILFCFSRKKRWFISLTFPKIFSFYVLYFEIDFSLLDICIVPCLVLTFGSVCSGFPGSWAALLDHLLDAFTKCWYTHCSLYTFLLKLLLLCPISFVFQWIFKAFLTSFWFHFWLAVYSKACGSVSVCFLEFILLSTIFAVIRKAARWICWASCWRTCEAVTCGMKCSLGLYEGHWFQHRSARLLVDFFAWLICSLMELTAPFRVINILNFDFLIMI